MQSKDSNAPSFEARIAKNDKHELSPIPTVFLDEIRLNLCLSEGQELLDWLEHVAVPKPR